MHLSEGCTAKANVYYAIECVKRNSTRRNRFEIKGNNSGRCFLSLRAKNGNTLAISRNHQDEDDLEADLEYLMGHLYLASTKELIADPNMPE